MGKQKFVSLATSLGVKELLEYNQILVTETLWLIRLTSTDNQQPRR